MFDCACLEHVTSRLSGDRNTAFAFIYSVGILLLLLLLLFAVVFHHKICVSISFDYFLDEASNFCYRILTNQKHKFVVENCQWKCMSQYFLNWNIHCAYYVGLTSFGIKKNMLDYCDYAVFECYYQTIRYQTTITMRFSHKSQKNKI